MANGFRTIIPLSEEAYDEFVRVMQEHHEPTPAMVEAAAQMEEWRKQQQESVAKKLSDARIAEIMEWVSRRVPLFAIEIIALCELVLQQRKASQMTARATAERE